MLVKKGFVETVNYVKGPRYKLTKKGQSAAKRHKDLYQ
jgi:predicted transcriptional regulator